MPNPNQPNPNQPTPALPQNDVLQAGPHQQLSSEEVAKAVARHNREHPAGKTNQPKPKRRR